MARRAEAKTGRGGGLPRKLARWYLLLGTFVLGVVLLASGLYMVMQGRQARSEVREALAAEKVNAPDPSILLTYPDARAPEGVTVPIVLVDTADEARGEAEAIRTHTLTATGGKTWSELPSQIEDPANPGKMIPNPLRNTFIQGLTLRTSLYQAHIGFEIGRLIIGLGALFAVLGGGVIALGSPLVYWSTRLPLARREAEPEAVAEVEGERLRKAA